MTNNPNFISGVDTVVQVADNIDHIHSGIVKSLNTMVGGNMVIEGCNITQDVSGVRTQFDVASGKYLRDGELISFGGNSITLGTNQLSSPTSTYDYYLLLVFDSNGALGLRGDNTLINGASPKVASFNPQDTILAGVKIAGGEQNNATRHLQFMTVDKAKNAVGVAYDDGGTYTETLSLIGGATGTTISNKLGNLTIQDGSSGGIVIAGDNVGLGGTVPTKKIHMETDSGTDEIVFIKNTSSTGNKGVFIETAGADTDKAFDITTTGGTSKASITSAGDLSIASNIQIGGNVIKASDGGSTITLDTDDNVIIAGDLTVAGGDIIGPTDGALTIKADTDMIFRIDADSDGAETFSFQSNNGNEIMSLDEAGNLQIDGDLNISGGNLATTAVTADLVFTTASGLNNVSDTFIANSGGKKEAAEINIGLLGDEHSSGNNQGVVTRVIQPILDLALDPANSVQNVRHEIVYLGLNTKSQVGQEEIIEHEMGGGANNSGEAYSIMVEGYGGAGTQNGLIGPGGFVCIDSPANAVNQKITFVNTSNIPCYIVASGNNTASSGSLLPCFHKGYKIRTMGKASIGHNCVNMSRQFDSQSWQYFNNNGYFIGDETTGLDGYLLREGASVTLHAIELANENNQNVFETQVTQGWNQTPPNAYWMVISSTESSLEGKVIYNTMIRKFHLGAPQSGFTVYFNYTLASGTIYLPPTPAVGTQYFIYAMSAVDIIAMNQQTQYIDAGNIVSNDMIRDAGQDVPAKSLSAGDMVTVLFGPDGKWLLVG